MYFVDYVFFCFFCCVVFLFFFFFFFQAEDGIRDRDVTGVQTCALPISLSRARYSAGDSRVGQVFESIRERILRRSREPAALAKEILAMREKMHAARSEERRVGKECRCGWAPYQEKKKWRAGGEDVAVVV